MNEQQDKTRLLLDDEPKDETSLTQKGEQEQKTPPSPEDGWSKIRTFLKGLEEVAFLLVGTIIALGAPIDVLILMIKHIQNTIQPHS